MNISLVTPTPRTVKTTCPYCGVGCGVAVGLDSSNNVTISGDDKHPANAGKLCSKGLALAQTLEPVGRLLSPEIKGLQCEWDDAIDHIASQLQTTIEQHGAESVAFYVSGQLLTEDYYVVNKLVKGYIGSANIDTNSRLCMASSVAGHKRAFGSDTVPGQYSDFESADLILLTGSNLAWCHPILQQRISAAKAARPELTVVVIDPRRTATAELADIHLQIKSNSDVALFNGLLDYLSSNGGLNTDYIQEHTVGIEQALAAASQLQAEQVAQLTGISCEQITHFYSLFTQTQKVMTVYSQGVNQSSTGTDTVNSIINCHLASGRIGKPGMGPFSVTGQPNAMGGREVGGLSNMLAAHMDLDNAEHQHTVQTFWSSPTLAKKPGLKAVELFDAIGQGKIKFLWIMATNPVVSMPEADAVKTALAACPFVVVSDVVSANDTLAFADVKLPAAAWSEKDGTVTNSERRISRQRAFRSLPPKVRPDWWAVCAVAKKLWPGDAFSYNSAADIFREHATLSGFHNNGTRDFDISACDAITCDEYDAMEPFVWPWRKGENQSERRFFSNGQFYTPTKRARLVPVLHKQSLEHKSHLVMNTGRVRDQWHTMTRTGFIPVLSAHYSEPFVELHPQDADKYAVANNDIVRIFSNEKSVLMRAVVSEKQQPDNLFVPMHWSDSHASVARVNALVSDTVDPVSGQPASKSALVQIEKYAAASYTFAVVKDWKLAKRIINRLKLAHAEAPFYWSRSVCERGWSIEIASLFSPLCSLQYWQHELLSINQSWVEFDDTAALNHRLACFQDDALHTAVFIGSNPQRLARGLLTEQLGAVVEPRRRYQIMAGLPSANQEDKGEIVCSCFMVGANQIQRCLRENQCQTVDSVGTHTNAGTNCGSCRGELQLLLNRHALSAEPQKLSV